MKLKAFISIILVVFSFCITIVKGMETEQYILIDPGHGEPVPSVT